MVVLSWGMLYYILFVVPYFALLDQQGDWPMKCPYCGELNNKVIDSRLNKDCTITRRRRACLACDQRFTTYERLEVMMPMLVKKDGRREAWDRRKMIAGLEKACEKDR